MQGQHRVEPRRTPAAEVPFADRARSSTPENVARIGVVDDHMCLRIGVASVVKSGVGMYVVASEGTVPALLARSTSLDLVVLDLRLADGSRPETNIALLRAVGAKVVCYADGDGLHVLRAANRAGSSAIISKAEHPKALLSAISTVLRGGYVPPGDWASTTGSEAESAPAGLTGRESQVLTLYASGRSADEVARDLNISRETVVDHVRKIRAKYARVGREAPTKVHLHQRAAEDGLLTY